MVNINFYNIGGQLVVFILIYWINKALQNVFALSLILCKVSFASSPFHDSIKNKDLASLTQAS